MKTYKLLPDGKIEATKPGPDQIEFFTEDELKRRYNEAMSHYNFHRGVVNETIDEMLAINKSGLGIIISDVPEKVKAYL